MMAYFPVRLLGIPVDAFTLTAPHPASRRPPPAGTDHQRGLAGMGAIMFERIGCRIRS